ncbi:MAG: S9 family peptidase, partial [Holophaga sp.]|nr:S9 family peptidase [Holophaga sp.]
MSFMHWILAPALILAAPSMAIPGMAAEKRAFTIEDLYRLKGVSSLSLSPDAARLLYQVSSQDLKKSTRVTQIWMLELATGTSRQLTFSDKSSTSPQWSADGKTIHFLSSREGGRQIWAMDLAGGEARKLTSIGIGLGTPKLHGNNVVFDASVFPESMADATRHKELSGHLENGPVQAHIADTLLYRHWTDYRDFQYTHLFTASMTDGKVQPITSGKLDYPGYGQSFDLSADGKAIVVATNTDAVPARSTNLDLFLINLDGDRTPQRLTGDNPAFDGDPKFSPDGRWIAYRLQRKPGFEADRFQLAVWDRTTKTSRVLTETIDNWVTTFQWSPDGKALWFTLDEKGRTPLHRVEVATGKIQRMLEGHTLSEYVLSPDQKAVLFTTSKVGEPVEIWRYGFEKKDLKRLTAINQAVADEVDIRPSEELWVKGANGTPVHVFVVKPHGFDPSKKYPLIINVHGGPQMQWTDSLRGDWQVYPGAGYVVAFPNPHGSTGYGQAFTDAISGDWDGKVITDIEKVTDALAKLPYVDADRMGAMGWSWGGYAMMWLEGHSTRYKALAAMMGVYDLPSMHGATEELWFPEWDL